MEGLQLPCCNVVFAPHGHISTHPFGNTEEHLRRANIGVKAQHADERWDNARGTGAVRVHKGLYHNAINVKRNVEFWLAIAEIFGGLNKVTRRLFKVYKEASAPDMASTAQYVAHNTPTPEPPATDQGPDLLARPRSRRCR